MRLGKNREIFDSSLRQILVTSTHIDHQHNMSAGMSLQQRKVLKEQVNCERPWNTTKQIVRKQNCERLKDFKSEIECERVKYKEKAEQVNRVSGYFIPTTRALKIQKKSGRGVGVVTPMDLLFSLQRDFVFFWEWQGADAYAILQ